MTKQNSNSKDYLDDGTRVASHHDKLLKDVLEERKSGSVKLDSAIKTSEDLLILLGRDLPEHNTDIKVVGEHTTITSIKPWDVILEEARQATPTNVDFSMLLTPEEIDLVYKRYAKIGNELSWFSSLDRYDWAIAVASGLVAGVLDILLVDLPKHKGFLGSKGSEGGWLSNLIKEKLGNLFPDDKIHALEKAYKVAYDPSTNVNLETPVPGLGPRTHRYQSLGHDPLLGFIFGVRDIIYGEFTGIGSNGHLIIQNITDPLLSEETFFVRIAEALKMHIGHLASDVATPAGLPAPLMPLLSFLQFGKIGNSSYTIAEVGRQMYRSGYDFRHFMAASIPVMLIEVMVRLGYFIRSVMAGKSLVDSIPVASDLKLRRQLLVAHSTAMLVNTGKVYFTANPLAISWPQVLAVLRYLLPELTYQIFGKEAALSQMVEDQILRDYHTLNFDTDQLLVL